MILNVHALHHICILTMICILDVCLLYWNDVFWLDWIGLSPWCFYCCMSHAHAFFMHTYLFFYLINSNLCWCFSAYLSLSFFWLVALWHLNISLLRLGTLFVLGHLLLILPPLTFGSVMRRPVRTSRRTFQDAAFIRNAKSSYRTFH